MTVTRMRAFVIGSVVGFALSVIGILTGALDIFPFGVADWQEILFFPGYFVGFQFYDLAEGYIPWQWIEIACILVGVLGVVAAYGGMAVLLRAVWIRLAGRRRGDAP